MAEADRSVLVQLRDIREALAGCERQLRDLEAAKFNNLGPIMALASSMASMNERMARLEDHLLGADA